MKYAQCALAVAASLLAVTAFGSDWVLKTGEWEIDDPAAYATKDGASMSEGNEELPVAGDKVTIPKDGIVNVDDDSVALASSLVQLYYGENAKVVVDVATNFVFDAAVGRGYYATFIGTFEKRGAGMMSKTKWNSISGSNYWDLRGVRIFVKAGAVDLYDVGASGKNLQFGAFDLAEGTSLKLPKAGSLYVQGLSGCGTVECPEADKRTFSIQAHEDFEFRGTFADSFSIRTISPSDAKLSPGMQSIYGAQPEIYAAQTYGGRLGVERFGVDKNDTSSSIGPSGMAFNNTSTTLTAPGGSVRYLGTGETTAKTFSIYRPSSELDAGATGGLVLTGSVTVIQSAAAGMYDFTLSGEGAAVNVISSKVEVASDKDLAFVKRGSGTWQFAAYSSPIYRKNAGPFVIENGTLQFGSIAEAGEKCALGFATNLVAMGISELGELSPVPYAYLLGTPETEATFEYVGTADASCSTRPLVVNGRGTLKNSGGASFAFGGITNAAGTDATLVLDGDVGSVASLGETADGSLSLEKAGAGTWMIDGDADFSGGISVKGGRLSVRNHDRFRYVRYTVKETYYVSTNTDESATSFSNGKYLIGGVQLAFYSAAGERVIPKSYTVTETGNYKTEPTYGPEKMSDPNTVTNGYSIGWRLYVSSGSGFSKLAHHDDSNTWVRLVMELPDDAPELVSYDLVLMPKNHTWMMACPSYYQIEGSVDGMTWTPLTEDITYDDLKDVYRGAATWLWGGNSFWTTKYTEDAPSAKPDGLADMSCEPQHKILVNGIGRLAVADGASFTVYGRALEADSLGVDVASGKVGAISGVKLAAKPTLDLTNLPVSRPPWNVSADLSGISGLETADWQVCVDGVPSRKYTAVVTPSGITIYGHGLMILLK